MSVFSGSKHLLFEQNTRGWGVTSLKEANRDVHFHGWIDYNGVAFSIELLEWGPKFSDFGGKKVLHAYQRLENVPKCL